ncbi:MAG: class I SAM-dependent methyltransferase [Burkholderiales bacterium]|nr:class I SAM-dependent methyltransferase [Burkholderiales bacterium]
MRVAPVLSRLLPRRDATGARAVRSAGYAGRLLFAAFLVGTAAFAAEPPERAPFITTPEEVVERMLELAGTGAGDVVMDLGSGDGRIVIAAARRFGARGIGVELDPRLVALARENATRAGVAERVEIVHGDVLRTDISRATVVTLYLLPSLIDQLQPRFLAELRPGTRIVSHAFAMAGWRADRVETVRLARRHPGQGDESRIFLWIVPAQARGEWRAPGWRLRISQNYQDIEVEAELEGRRLAVSEARLAGARLEFAAQGLRYAGRIAGDRLAGELARGGERAPLEFVRR